MHAVVTTPAQSMGACFAHFPTNDRLPRAQVGSACALPFSRPARRLLTLRPACSPNPLKDPLHRRLQPIRYLHGCSDCYRPERKLPDGICTRRKTAPWHGALERMVSVVIGPLPKIAPRKHWGPSLWQGGSVVPRKTDVAMVHFARGLAWSWVASSTLVNRLCGLQPLGRYPV